MNRREIDPRRIETVVQVDRAHGEVVGFLDVPKAMQAPRQIAHRLGLECLVGNSLDRLAPTRNGGGMKIQIIIVVAVPVPRLAPRRIGETGGTEKLVSMVEPRRIIGVVAGADGLIEKIDGEFAVTHLYFPTTQVAPG